MSGNRGNLMTHIDDDVFWSFAVILVLFMIVISSASILLIMELWGKILTHF